MIKAVIFDMDGLLIDSEPFWDQVCLKKLGDLGVPKNEIRKPHYLGLGAREYFGHFYTEFSWGDTPSLEEIINESTSAVAEMVKIKGVAMPGAVDTVKKVKSHGLQVAVASSSAMHLIETVISKLNLAEYIDFYYSGTSEDFGKPHPGIFLHSANKMGLNYNNCLVFEDSINGVIAAKAAKMACIAVPEKNMQNDNRFSIADRVLHSLNDFKIEMLITPN